MGSKTQHLFAEDFTSLKWRFEDHWSGETARFDVCGLHAWVRDLDGDAACWEVRKGRRGFVVAEGERCDGVYDFFECLRDCEGALRRIVTERIAALRLARPAPTPEDEG